MPSLKQTTAVLAATYCLLTAGNLPKNQNCAIAGDIREDAPAFRARLIAADNEQQLFSKWSTQQQPAAPNDPENVTASKEVSLYVVYGGCKTDNAGSCDVSIKVQVLGQDNTPYSETPTMKIWHSRTPPVPKTSTLETNHFRLVIQLPPEPGLYAVQAQLIDNNADTAVALRKKFSKGSQAATPSTTSKEGN